MKKGKLAVKKNVEEEDSEDNFQETGDEENFSAVVLDESLLNVDLFGQVNEKMVLTFKRYFLKLVKFYRDLPGKKNPMTITINSSGGNANDGFAIFDIIRSSGMPVTTVALGSAESAALIIFLAGSKRRIHQNALLLTHETHEHDLEGRAHTAHSLVTIGNQLLITDKLISKIILENSKITPQTLARLKKSEKLIIAEEAVKYGLAHEIIRNN